MSSQLQQGEIHEYFSVITAIINDLTKDTEDVIKYLIAVKIGKIYPGLIPLDYIIDSLKEATSQSILPIRNLRRQLTHDLKICNG